MMDAISKLFCILFMLVFLAACGSSQENLNLGSSTYRPESPDTSTQQTESPSIDEQQTERPQTFNLPEGESASARAMLNSDVTAENIEYTMYNFLEDILLDVDQFWSDIMIQNGLPEPHVYYSFPGPGESIYDICADAYTKKLEAYYCSLDDTIVLTQEMATHFWEGTVRANSQSNVPYNAGDFSVAVVVAHEYAHSLQEERGWFPNGRRVGTSRSIELNADCLAGVWANSVYARGLLEYGDIEEVMRTLSDLGNDIEKNKFSHGLPSERTDAFLLGYVDGSARSCDKYLKSEY